MSDVSVITAEKGIEELIAESILSESLQKQLLQILPDASEQQKQGIITVLTQADQKRREINKQYHERTNTILSDFDSEVSAFVRKKKMQWNKVQENVSRNKEGKEMEDILKEL